MNRRAFFQRLAGCALVVGVVHPQSERECLNVDFYEAELWRRSEMTVRALMDDGHWWESTEPGKWRRL